MTVEEKENEIDNYRKALSGLSCIFPYEYTDEERKFIQYKYIEDEDYTKTKIFLERKIEEGISLLDYKFNLKQFVDDILHYYSENNLTFGKLHMDFTIGWYREKTNIIGSANLGDLPSHARGYFKIKDDIYPEIICAIEEHEYLSSAFYEYITAQYFLLLRNKTVGVENSNKIVNMIIHHSTNGILLFHNFLHIFINSCAFEYLKSIGDTSKKRELLDYIDGTKSINNAFNELLKLMGFTEINLEDDYSIYNDSKLFRNSLTHFCFNYKNQNVKKNQKPHKPIRTDYNSYITELENSVTCLDVALKFWQIFKEDANSSPGYLLDLDKNRWISKEKSKFDETTRLIKEDKQGISTHKNFF